MIVIGIDGATWDIIKPNIDKLPTFKKLLSSYYYDTLECDVRPVHSAPSWSTIFSGVLPEKHGIKDFILDKKKIENIKNDKMFIWNQEKNSIVLSIPISFPPIMHNCELENWVEVTLSVAEDEMFKSTDIILENSKKLLKRKPNLFITVFYETDRSQHMFWNDKNIILSHYRNVDSALGEILDIIHKKDFVILSDHGFTDAEITKKNKWDVVRKNQTGGHHPNGIIISNRKPPKKVSEVYKFLKINL